jgi:hypothetical protein
VNFLNHGQEKHAKRVSEEFFLHAREEFIGRKSQTKWSFWDELMDREMKIGGNL